VVLRSGKIKAYPAKILIPKIDSNGYQYLHLLGHLRKGEFPTGRRKYVRVHRLVLLTFVGSAPFGTVACHYNGDPSDNRLENLRYDTYKNNSLDTIRHGRARGWDSAGENNGRSRLTESDVIVIRTDYASGLYLQRELAAKYGVQQSCISKVLLRVTYTHTGDTDV
jgi:hypothetical protein